MTDQKDDEIARLKQELETLKAQPRGTGTVGPNQGPPAGYYWDRLDATDDKAELTKLREELDTQRYSRDGLIYQAVQAKLDGKETDQMKARREAGLTQPNAKAPPERKAGRR